MTEGKGILATVPDTRLAVPQFTLCLTCFEWISGSVSSVNTCLGFDSSSIPGFLWNRFVCHPCIWVHVRLLWTHLQQVMNLLHISHCHIFVWHINPSLSLRDFFFWLGFSKGFLHLCLFLMTVQNVLSNGKSYSGKQECGLAHTESPSFTHEQPKCLIQKRASFHWRLSSGKGSLMGGWSVMSVCFSLLVCVYVWLGIPQISQVGNGEDQRIRIAHLRGAGSWAWKKDDLLVT